ncbi:hypothetical protein COCNU_02G016630 [Cocos nucifera]|uniref:Uncharacterized protein n=1 Tax=Cocos nucifera TaxID=13894 RepID=A0A8K0I075_COCNU|nr:hypothetical protein COCNU_02G016630 [Cocos nucifera]
MEVPPGAKSWDSRSGLGDYQVARSLSQSILLSADMETMDRKSGTFQVRDSYDSLLRLTHHLDHFSDAIQKARRISKEAKEKANQANRRANDAELSKLKAEEELKRERRRLESKLSKVQSNFEAWLEAKKKKYEGELEASKVNAVEAFKSSIELRDIKADFASLSYIQVGIDLKEKLKKILPDFNLVLVLLESDNEEEADEGGDGKI